MKNIYFIRHFKTPWNIEGRLQGRRDISICETRDANETQVLQNNINALDGIGFDAVYCSPLIRTSQTAIAHGLKNPTVLPNMIELDFGALEGMPKSTMRKSHGDDWDNAPQNLPLGESFDDFVMRVKDVHQTILSNSESTVLLFGHGAWSRCFKCIVDGTDPTQMNSFEIPNGQLVQFSAR
ncbi:hypothetical protein GCM10008927_13280 [Amylibacter ulvae]|uniref:Phosphoglycerate mutase n=1 Tax=Paramylibacter ulvae TaxID=1651968 RepID=A0ABQ3CY36_9RHOB|nr:histidine phosphatase family protein [Amylibacter ulvae]GHA49414.1 hypothetical protein GCM10008927_13280 [Amylibacter ulvae]